MNKLIRTFTLSIGIIQFDYKRRYSQSIFGIFWFFAPFFATIAIAGTPNSINGKGTSVSTLYSTALLICIVQLVINSASETARLARRNRRLIAHLGPKSIVANLSGLLVSLFLFAMQLCLISFAYLALGMPYQPLMEKVGYAIMLTPSLALLGLGLSLVVSLLSSAILDIRYSFQFLPLLGLILIPLDETTTESGTSSILNAMNPLWAVIESGDFSSHVSFTVLKFVGINVLVLIALVVALKKLQHNLFALLISRSI
jgi:ABC-type polysaccharide/polyol phosphate export permease